MNLSTISLLEMSLYGGVMILGVALLRRAFARRMPKALVLGLWAVALFRLLVPLALPSPFKKHMLYFASPIEDGAVTTAAKEGETIITALTAILPYLWGAGVLIALLCHVVPYLRQRKVFSMALPFALNEEERSAINHFFKMQGIRRPVGIYMSDRITTPLTYGILRPRIILPRTQVLTAGEFHHVLAHECHHIRRFDVLRKFVVAATLCIHWFNPLVYVMARCFNRDLECLCDASVVRKLPRKERAAYAHTLLSLEEKKWGHPVLQAAFSGCSTEERIRHVMTDSRPGKAAVAVGIFAVLAMGVCFATGEPAPVYYAAKPAAIQSYQVVQQIGGYNTLSPVVSASREAVVVEGNGYTLQAIGSVMPTEALYGVTAVDFTSSSSTSTDVQVVFSDAQIYEGVAMGVAANSISFSAVVNTEEAGVQPVLLEQIEVNR